MVISVNSHTRFWQDKRVLVTGHTGFKGSWLAIYLNRMGAEVTGISLPPTTSPNLFSLAKIDQLCSSHFCDIRDLDSLKDLVRDSQPEIVFHLAAQPLVRASYREPVSTFSTNVMGTVNVLEALRNLDSLKAVVMITTDKVYQNNESIWPYREIDTLGGHDPYSASKAASEIIISSYRDAFYDQQSVAIASARSGNVIGGGDWSEDRLIPDAIRAWLSGKVLDIRQPKSTRPWQHVLEPLSGYILLAEQIFMQPEKAGAYNFGPPTHEVATVHEVIELARAANEGGSVIYGDGSVELHESGRLALEIAKAQSILGYQPRWSLSETIHHTIAWYKSQQNGESAQVLCVNDIEKFEAL